MKEYIGIKIKLNPTNKQKEELEEYFNLSRSIYNIGISIQEEHYKRFKNGEEKYALLTFIGLTTKFNQLKIDDKKYAWIAKFDQSVVKYTLKEVVLAYKRFLDGINNKPKYKKKKYSSKKHFPIREDRLEINKDSIRLSKKITDELVNADVYNESFIGCSYYRKTINPNTKEKYCNTRIIFDGVNYYLSFGKEVSKNINYASRNNYINNSEWLNKPYSEPVGIDLGCKKNNWIVDSSSNRVTLPDTTKVQKRIIKYNKKFMRKKRTNDRLKNMGMKTKSTKSEKHQIREYTNKEKETLVKLNKQYKHKTNIKKNAVYEYANNLVKSKPKCIIIEDLKLNEMYIRDKNISSKRRKNHNRVVREASLYMVQDIITKTAVHNNIDIIRADKQYPSTQICSCCGNRQHIGSRRIYNCPICGLSIDRDYNASINLANYYSLN